MRRPCFALASFPTLTVGLEPYSTLLLYTDGLIEYDRNIERESVRLLDALSARVQDRTADGAGMLLHQGALAFEAWTGRTAPRAAMARALARA